MISSEVQRTLVKSPPELWAELSDPAALARHLGELGEIRIVRTKPESTVEWAAENTTGTVSIKPSGWGTRVTLSVTKEMVVQHEPVEEAKQATTPSPAPEQAAAPEPSTNEPEQPVVAEATRAVDAESAPRRGFFARLFRRRRNAPAQPTAVEPTLRDTPAIPARAPEQPAAPDAFAAVRQALALETFAAEHPFAALAPVDFSAEPMAAEEPDADEVTAAMAASTEEVTAVLTAALDRLGAAHHRPFSRS